MPLFIGENQYSLRSGTPGGDVPAGTEGTPIATKSTVSNHSVTVTPSVTNIAGLIAGGTHTGEGVSVSASELVSGSETKAANGTYDVTNLEELVVNVPSEEPVIQALSATANGTYNPPSGVDGYAPVTVNVSGTPPTTIQAGTTPVAMNTTFNRRAGTSYAEINSGCRITIKKAGTYRFTWVMFRTATSGTYGTQLYKDTSAQGSAKTTFTNSYYAICTQDVTCAVNDSIRIYGRSNSTTTYIYAGYLTASILWTNGF